MVSRPDDVAVIGAGPYGLSVAAHLRGAGVGCRVFGRPMETWTSAMPAGMMLKSDGFASSLSDPGGRFTLGRYCEEIGHPYADRGLPVPLETFVDYGRAFQRRFVPDLDERSVVGLSRVEGGFALLLDDGEALEAGRVIVAVGITHFASVPDVLSSLPPELSTHSAEHVHFDRFAGQTVAVVGAGASAFDVSAQLHRAGADVRLLARSTTISFHGRMPEPRPLRDRLRAPSSCIGAGWKSRVLTDAAPLFHRLPEERRLNITRYYLGPSGGYPVRDEVVGHVPMIVGTSVVDAVAEDGRVRLELDSFGAGKGIAADHVIAATGYRPDLARLPFLDEVLRREIRSVEGTPILSSAFEASVPGLHFVGLVAANSFGPMLRFACGAGFTARRLSRHLAGRRVRAGARR